ncbi:MAG: Ku protein [Alphaproteobacteria bacterium]|jgi:DNA end-binding protein Ku|nr:Ku protein [Alphaproteobacteria bacterium]
MAARAYWRGHIRLSLVTCPVRLYSAIETGGGRISFNQIHKPTGKRVRSQPWVEDEGPVDRDEIVKGYAYGEDRYVIVEKEELDEIKVESSHTIDIVRFCDRDDIDPVYHDRPYYLAPDGKVGAEAYVTIREALAKSGKVAIGQISFAGREHIAAIQPCGRGLQLETLHYANEVRDADPFFDEVPEVEIEEDQLELAEVLIDRKSKPFDATDFVDHYEAAVRELVEAKIEHREPEVEAPRAPEGKVVNIMDALKRSLEEEEGGKPAGGRKSGGKSGGKTGGKTGGRSGGKPDDTDGDGGEAPRRRRKSA